jgi:hypothetical protein
MNCVQRGLRLFNKTDNTYTFTSPVTVDLVEGLDFEDMPSSARMYITIKAARKYQDRYFGDPNTHSYTIQDELQARAAMMQEELDSTDPNMLTDSQFVRNLLART